MNSIKNFIKNYWVWIGFAVILIVISIVMYRSRKKRLEEEAKIVEQTGQDASFPLQPYELVSVYSAAKGSMGAQIKKLQEINNANNTTDEPLVVDGKYGPKSLAAFRNTFANDIASNGTVAKSQYEQILSKFNN